MRPYDGHLGRRVRVPARVGHVAVTVQPTSEAAAAAVRRDVEQALVGVDCDEGTQLGRVPFAVIAPAPRPIALEAVVRMRPGVKLDTARPDLESRLRGAFSRGRLASSGPKLCVPSASDLTDIGIEEITWRVDGSGVQPGESLSYTGEVQLLLLGSLVVRESDADADLSLEKKVEAAPAVEKKADGKQPR